MVKFVSQSEQTQAFQGLLWVIVARNDGQVLLGLLGVDTILSELAESQQRLGYQHIVGREFLIPADPHRREAPAAPFARVGAVVVAPRRVSIGVQHRYQLLEPAPS